MPVVGCRNNHRIDVLAFKQVSVVRYLLYVQVGTSHFLSVVVLNKLLSFCHPLAIQIRYSHNARHIMLPYTWQIMISSDSSATDLSNLNFIAGCIFPKYGGRNKGWYSKRCCSEGSFFHKISSLHGYGLI